MKRYLLAAAAFLAGCSQANAAIITKVITYTATGFTDFAGGAAVAPVDTFAIKFKVSYDNTVALPGNTSNIDVLSLSYPIASAVGITYQPQFDAMAVGGTFDGVDGIDPSSADFLFVVFDVSSAMPAIVNVFYTTGVPDSPIFVSSQGLLTSSPAPEPATWAMLVGGFGLVSAALRRKQASIASPDTQRRASR